LSYLFFFFKKIYKNNIQEISQKYLPYVLLDGLSYAEDLTNYNTHSCYMNFLEKCLTDIETPS